MSRKTKRNVYYDHKSIEAKWQKVWDKKKIYYPDTEKAKKPYYNLWMFPYPSAEGLHIGHAFTSSGGDIHGRFMRMMGYDVFQPTGYDAFGIHSENYALKIGENPLEVVKRTTKHYEEQLRSLGHGYDWTRTVTTSDPDYYHWTQWLFVTLFKAGLAYKKTAKVNFCPSCKTVLADEQVMTPKQAGKEPKDGKGNPVPLREDLRVCERCGTIVEIKQLKQWFFRITDYAEKLLGNIGKIDWTAKVKIAQREWIGKSKGLTIEFTIKNNQFSNKIGKLQISNKKSKPTTIPVWTKFWETVYGVTFIVVSPEYAQENLLKIMPKKYANEVNAYIKLSLSKSEQERSEVKEKSGVLTGIEALNPVNGDKVPIFVADYVLGGVGTGAVMGVPAHDERDFLFARKYKLPIRKVVDVQTETHSLVIKRSVTPNFLEEIKKAGWYFTDYEDWAWGVVFPKGEELKYINIVQSNLNDGPWYVHTDGVLKEVIFKDKHFSVENANERAKEHARGLGIPEEQIDWDNRDNYMFAHEKGGKIVNSGNFNGLDAWTEGKERMARWMVKEGFGKWETNYHLRDWLISRQRYWGCPIPMVYCQKCAREGRGWILKNPSKPLHKKQDDWEYLGWWPEEKLPVELPYIKDWKPEGTGKGPLANHPDFFQVKCPECGSGAERETDVADTFLDSSWYFLRYPSVGSESSKKLPFDPEITKKWLPVNLYFGGAEHAVLHLMYSRFITMVLNDLKYLDFDEPFPKFVANGLVIKDGAKMSKSRGNVINPDEYVEKYGADTLRAYLVFMGPMDGYPDFRDAGIEGMGRFITRIWSLFSKVDRTAKGDPEITTKMHQTIKKVSSDVGTFNYNTAIAAIMEFVNKILEKENYSEVYLETLVKLLAPFTPHLAEEVWSNLLKKEGSIHTSSWPKYDERLAQENELVIVVQVNGKVRGQLLVAREGAEKKEEVVALAKKNEKVSSWLKGKEVKKEIFVPGKLVNFVV